MLCQEKKVDWPFGYELCDKLKRELGDLVSKIAVTDVNRICIETTSDKLRHVAKKLREVGFDHVKSVNVIDLIQDGKFVVEFF